jgi:hypothetical protein
MKSGFGYVKYVSETSHGVVLVDENDCAVYRYVPNDGTWRRNTYLEGELFFKRDEVFSASSIGSTHELLKVMSQTGLLPPLAYRLATKSEVFPRDKLPELDETGYPEGEAPDTWAPETARSTRRGESDSPDGTF